MDFEAQRKKRMEDLAVKRKRLEEMRKQRSEKSNTPELSTEVSSTPPPPPVTTTTSDTSVDDLVNSLLESNTEPPPVNTTITDDSSDSTPAAPAPVLSRLEQTRLRSAKWTTCQSVSSFTIQPFQPEVYEKGIQTDAATEFNQSDIDVGGVSSPPQDCLAYHRSPQRPRQRSRGDSVAEEELSHRLANSTVAKTVPVPYTPEQVNDIVVSSSFHSFLAGSAHIVERALGLSNSIDLLRDLTGRSAASAASSSSGGSGSNADVLQRARVYESARVGIRPVMDIQASPHHNELFATAHGAAASSSASPDSSSSSSGGVVCLWSVLLPSDPEFVFTASSPVLMVRFHPDNVHLLIGACYSGQVVIWDTRNAASQRPVQRSSSSGKGHKHPVYSMCLARVGSGSGSKTASSGNNWVLITASTDGLLCHWDLESLTEPVSSASISSGLVLPSVRGLGRADSSSGISAMTSSASSSSQSSTSEGMSAKSSSAGSLERPISVSCMVLGPEEDERKLVLGSECGTLFCFSLPFKPAAPHSKTGAHFGMITSLSVNPSTLPAFRHLLLTASVDWTVKLWRLQSLSATVSLASVQPLLTFSAASFQYVTSVQWSPAHPGVFSAIASGGTLMLWNICQSSVAPVGVMSIQCKAPPGGRAEHGSSALNKTVWLDDGRKVLVGDSSGGTHCVAVRSATAVALRSGDEDRLELALSAQPHKLGSVANTRQQREAGSGDMGGSVEEKQECEAGEEAY